MFQGATLAVWTVVLLLSCRNALLSTHAAPLVPTLHKATTLQLQRAKTAALAAITDVKGKDPSGVKASIDCDVCKVVVSVAQDMFESNKTEDEVAKLITTICIDLHIEDRNVCSLVIPEFKVSC